MVMMATAELNAQVTLEGKQGTGWASWITLGGQQSPTFRWTWNAATAIQAAVWQMAFAAPGAPTGSHIVASGMISPVPARSTPGTFTVPVPPNAPPTFHVRVRTAAGFSNWVPVTLPQTGTPVQAPPPPPTSGTTQARAVPPPPPAILPQLDTRRKSVMPPPPPVLPSPPKQTVGVPQPLTQTVGTAVANTQQPLWVVLTQIWCDEETTEMGEGDSDEVYALVFAIAPNKAKPQESKFIGTYTKVFEDLDDNEPRSPSLNMWGVTGSPSPMAGVEGSYFAVALQEHDGGSPGLMAGVIMGKIQQRLNALPDNVSYETIKEAVNSGVDESGVLGPTASDDPIGDLLELRFTAQEVAYAQAGGVVKRELVAAGNPGVSGSKGGKYRVRFQMGRAGVSTVPW
jgi:hypothetical protein